MKPHTSSLLSAAAAALLATSASSAVAQAPLDVARVALTSTDASLDIAVVQPDGKLLVGGGFDAVHGQLREGIARLHADGSLDTTWQPDCRGVDADDSPFSAEAPCRIEHILVEPNGGIIVAGSFAAFGQTPRAGLARLDPVTGALDTAWEPLLPTAATDIRTIHDIALLSDGIVVSTSVVGANGEAPTLRKYSLDGTGQQLATFQPGISDAATIESNGSGLLFAVGTDAGGSGVRRLDPATGATDEQWSAGVDVLEQSLRFDVASSSLIAIATTSPLRLYKLRPLESPAVDPQWNPTLPAGSSSAGNAIVTNSGGQGAIALNIGSDTSIAVFSTAGSGGISALHPLPTGPLTAFIELHAIDAAGRTYAQRDAEVLVDWAPGDSPLFRLRTDGAVDSSWITRVFRFATIADVAVDGMRRLLLAGEFTHANGERRAGLARLLPSLALDPTWIATTGQSTPRAIIADAQGDVFAGGGSMFQGAAWLMKLSGADGSVVATWNPGGTLPGSGGNPVHDLRIGPSDGRVYVAGQFAPASVCGLQRSRIARVSSGATCAADPTWTPVVNARALQIEPQDDGSTLVEGQFQASDATPVWRLARIHADGSLDATWQPFPTSGLFPFVADLLTTDDGLLVAGAFTNIGGRPVPGALARISLLDASADPNWEPAAASRYGPMAKDAQWLLVVRTLVDGAPLTTRHEIVRIDLAGNGDDDPAWMPLEVSGGTVQGMTTLESDVVAAWGGFSRIGDTGTGSFSVIGSRAIGLFQDGFEP
jgi:uncharacterized delta-60 repeat protein